MTDRRVRTAADLNELTFDDRGLVPVVTQDETSGRVLMIAYANRAALEKTLETGRMHYWSRSRNELWEKGATSGNRQTLVSLHADCDGDALLARVEPAGPACHTGEETCFGDGSGRSATPGANFLNDLWTTLESRAEARPEGSYTTRLLDDENLRLKKLGEENTELTVALARGETESVPEEAADLLYHLFVALLGAGTSFDEVVRVLEARHRGG